MPDGKPGRVLITGVTGQDGAYLARRLIDLGWQVYGGTRETKTSAWRLQALGIQDSVIPVTLDYDKPQTLLPALEKSQPDWIFNLAAISSLGESEAHAERTRLVNFERPRLLFSEAIRYNSNVRIFQASSALVFGYAACTPQTEKTPRQPDTHYGHAKSELDTYLAEQRRAGIHAVSGILYNHESPLRGEQFVSTKIVSGLAGLKAGGGDALSLGSLDDVRDWSHADDFAAGMVTTLETDQSDEWIFASGEGHKVRDWLMLAASFLGFQPVSEVSQNEERVICQLTGRLLAIAHRPMGDDDAHLRIGCPQKLENQLGWAAAYGFEDLVEEMTRSAYDQLTSSM